MSSALATGGGGTAARAAASARNASRALCGVIIVGSRSGSSGMIFSMTGSSGAGMAVLGCSWSCLAGSIGVGILPGNLSQLVIPGRDEVTNPESITTIVSMDSGPAPKGAHPGMTIVEGSAIDPGIHSVSSRKTNAGGREKSCHKE